MRTANSPIDLKPRPQKPVDHGRITYDLARVYGVSHCPPFEPLARELDRVEDTTAKRVGAGDLSLEVSADSSVLEFNELAESIEMMRQRLAKQIRTLDGEVAKQTEALTARNSDLAHEIETRRAAEEMAQQASRAKSEFLATIRTRSALRSTA